MNTFLLSFFAFVAVMLVMMLAYGVWARFFDRRNKAKKQQLQSIQDTVHRSGQSLSSAQSTIKSSAFESWLRPRSRIFRQLETLVRRAHSPIAAGRLMGLILALFTVVVVFGLLHEINPMLLLLVGVAIASTPVMWLYKQTSKSRKAFENKLPETLDYISRALRAGQSLTSAIGMIHKEFPDPIGQEFKTVSDEISFGIPFKDALGHLSDRVKSNDLNFFVISLVIHHETGGNLTELLDGLAKTIRERVKLRGKIRTLASEGRASAWVLGCMPFGFAAIISLVNPDYLSVIRSTPQGHTLLLISGGLMTVGFFLLKRIIQIKV